MRQRASLTSTQRPVSSFTHTPSGMDSISAFMNARLCSSCSSVRLRASMSRNDTVTNSSPDGVRKARLIFMTHVLRPSTSS
jgi:hypothetical protein